MNILIGIITGLAGIFLLAFVSHSFALLIAHTAIGVLIPLDLLTILVMAALVGLFSLGLELTKGY